MIPSYRGCYKLFQSHCQAFDACSSEKRSESAKVTIMSSSMSIFPSSKVSFARLHRVSWAVQFVFVQMLAHSRRFVTFAFSMLRFFSLPISAVKVRQFHFGRQNDEGELDYLSIINYPHSFNVEAGYCHISGLGARQKHQYLTISIDVS